MPRTIVVFLVAILLAFAGRPAGAATPQTPLLLLSIDGFRPDYLERGVTPTLNAVAAEGVRAVAMRPSFPVNTFPNHYTLVTGLRPDRHGITDNNLFDDARPGVKFSMGARDQVGDRFWWDEGLPIWVSAEQAGMRTAPMFWPGSEAAVRGVRPWRYMAYDARMTDPQRVDQILAWLDLPVAERPVFMTLYFETIDTTGHHEGPDSPALNAALGEVDAAVARLVEGLKARGLYDHINIVIVSDHGMAPTSPDRQIALDELFGADSFRWVTLGSMAGLVPTDAEAEKRIVGEHPNVTCWRKGELPARFAYGTNPRIPPVICLARTGWTLTTRQRLTERPPMPGGAHSYDPDEPLMQANFIAHGPAFRRGVVLPRFDNVSVYPLLAKLLGLTPAPNDGRLSDTAAALR